MTRRINLMKESGIRKAFDKAVAQKSLINFAIGQPDFEVPEKIKKSMIDAIRKNKTAYTPSSGIEEFKKKILLKNKFAESVIITSGVSAAIFLAYSSILEEDDELIIFSPYFILYPNIAKFLNIKPVFVKTNEDFSINIQKLEKSITKKTKAIMLNSPNNPTGRVYTRKEILKIVNIAKKNKLWLISDEIYKEFVYDSEFESVGPHYKRSIILNGFSKKFAMAGLRLGYALGPKKIIDEMTKLQQYTFVCAPSISQYGVLENIDLDVRKNILMFKRRRDYVYSRLKKYYEIKKPSGAFYFYIKLNGIKSKNFAELCLQKGLLVVSSEAFSSDDRHFRISYSASDEKIRKGINILIDIAKILKKSASRKIQKK